MKPFGDGETEEDESDEDESESEIDVEEEEEIKEESPKRVQLRAKSLKESSCVKDRLRERIKSRRRNEACSDLKECDKIDSEKESTEEITESIEDLSLETEDTKMEMTSDESGKVTITTEPKMDDSLNGEEIPDETIGEVDTEVEDEIKSNSEEDSEEEISSEDETADDESKSEDEVEVDEFDEETFESLGESYLKKVYSNVESFKVNKVHESNSNRLFVEGLITFNSGNTKKTNFVFKNCGVSKRGKTVFEGYNKEITRANKSFRLKGRVEGKKIISESLSYRYNQNKKRINGIVK